MSLKVKRIQKNLITQIVVATVKEKVMLKSVADGDYWVSKPKNTNEIFIHNVKEHCKWRLLSLKVRRIRKNLITQMVGVIVKEKVMLKSITDEDYWVSKLKNTNEIFAHNVKECYKWRLLSLKVKRIRKNLIT